MNSTTVSQKLSTYYQR